MLEELCGLLCQKLHFASRYSRQLKATRHALGNPKRKTPEPKKHCSGERADCERDSCVACRAVGFKLAAVV